VEKLFIGDTYAQLWHKEEKMHLSFHHPSTFWLAFQCLS